MDWTELYVDDFDSAVSRELDEVLAQIEYHREQITRLRARKRELEALLPGDPVAEMLDIAAVAWEEGVSSW
jgi:hypothetical protein